MGQSPARLESLPHTFYFQNSFSMRDCTFCQIVAGQLSAEVIYEDEETIAFLDIAPVARGHTLVVPKQHARNLFDIDTVLAARVAQVTAHIAPHLVAAVGADGLTVSQNNERAAGQDVFHYHVHLIPRWERPKGFPRLLGRPSLSRGELAAIGQSIRDQMRRHHL
jgi:histidine triad (HIT) family protein